MGELGALFWIALTIFGSGLVLVKAQSQHRWGVFLSVLGLVLLAFAQRHELAQQIAELLGGRSAAALAGVRWTPLIAFAAVAVAGPVLGTLWQRRRFRKREELLARHAQPPVSLGEPKGFLDHMVEGKAAGEDSRAISGLITEDILRMGSLMRRGTRRLSLLQALNLVSPQRVHRIAARVANELDAATGSLELRLAPFRNASLLMVSGHAGAIDFASGKPLSATDRLAVESLRDTLQGTSRVIRESLQATAGFRAIVQALRAQRITQALSEKCVKLIRTLDRLAQTMSEIANRMERITGQVNRLLESSHATAE